jgi:hypothetical protein
LYIPGVNPSFEVSPVSRPSSFVFLCSKFSIYFI